MAKLAFKLNIGTKSSRQNMEKILLDKIETVK